MIRRILQISGTRVPIVSVIVPRDLDNSTKGGPTHGISHGDEAGRKRLGLGKPCAVAGVGEK